MKKDIALCLILVSILVLVPINVTKAITQKQINAEVQIVCTDGKDNWFSGSGTIIDPKGIILTNRHVVEGAYKNICFIGFLESIDKDPNFGTKDNPNLAEVKYITDTRDMDAAVLYLDNQENKIYPYVNIWNSNSSSLKFGDKIEVIGYPGIGGSTITYSSGDFSGFGSLSDGTQNYIKSTAVLEHGNSGGSSYNQKGLFVGIPTMVVTGELNSISYILSVDSINKWLSGFLGSDYKQEIVEQKPVVIEQPRTSLKNDVTPPRYNIQDIELYQYNLNNDLKNHSSIRGSSTVYEFPKVSFGWKQNCFNETRQSEKDSCIVDDTGSIEGYYYYFGANPNAIPKTDGKYISADELSKDTYWKSVGLSGEYDVKLPFTLTASKGKNYFILQAKDNNNNISNPLINTEYIYEIDEFKDIKSFEIKDYKNKPIGIVNYPDYDEIPGCHLNEFCLENRKLDYTNILIYTNQTTLYLYPGYGRDIDGLVYYVSYGDDRWWSDKTRKGNKTASKYIKVDNLDQRKVTNLFIKPNQRGMNEFLGKHVVLSIEYKKNILKKVVPAGEYKSGNLSIVYADNKIDNSKKGKILLQVESRGEAWYVSPKDGRRYYLANGDKAYEAMRGLGVGITNNNLNKIKTNKVFAKNYSGKIFIQVESKGEAYYLDFDGNAHYLKDGLAAYEVMRSLGLGITNADLNKISVGSL